MGANRVETLLAFKSSQILFIRNLSLANVFPHSVWSKFKMKRCVNTMNSFGKCSGAAKCTFHFLKQNKQCAKLHPTSLHIYSLRSFPDLLLKSPHVQWLRGHKKRREQWEGHWHAPVTTTTGLSCVGQSSKHGGFPVHIWFLSKQSLGRGLGTSTYLGRGPRTTVWVWDKRQEREGLNKEYVKDRIITVGTWGSNRQRSFWDAHCRCSEMFSEYYLEFPRHIW